MGVTGSDRALTVWDAQTGAALSTLEGHPGGTYACRFFPSGKLVLSGGAEGCLRIWTIADGRCAVLFKGHSGGVLAVAIVDRGRNIVSSSRDGTIKLWDCATQSPLASFAAAEPLDERRAVNACMLISAGGHPVAVSDSVVDLGTICNFARLLHRHTLL